MKQRYSNLDLLRIIACFFVVFMHSMLTPYYGTPFKSFDWNVINLYCATGRNTVPMFLMISGMLILSREEYSLKKLFTRNVPKMFFIFFLWATLYAVDELGVKNLISNFNLKTLLNAILDFKYHLWYLPSMIAVYWMVPIFRAIRKEQKVLKYIVLMFFIFAIVRTTMVIIPQLMPLAKLMTRFDFAFATCSGYFITGYVIYTNQDKIRLSNFALIAVLVGANLVAAVCNYFSCVLQNSHGDRVYDIFTFFSFVEACAMFLLFLRIPSEKLDSGINKGGWIQRIAKYTLVIYLLHPFVIEHLEDSFGITATFINPILGAPLLALMVFIICTAVAFVLDKIPGVRKILV